MRDFVDRIAVVTGGGSGMGRELVRQLAAEGCHVATCDVAADALAETRALSRDGAPTGTTVTTFVADVADEQQIFAFRDAVATEHRTDHINLLFNNAGIGGGGSFVLDDREEWDATFAVCWGGVYTCLRAFMPMLLAAAEGHVVNTSSVNGFWASLGPSIPHTAYSAAKFAVKGLTEALITDFRLNAPHLRASVVMPGHIGTSIVFNSGRYLGRDLKDLTDEQVAEARLRFERQGFPVDDASDEDIRQGVVAQAELFQATAPMSPAAAATVILDGVRAEQWRILVGGDAALLDEMVRQAPESAYDPDFVGRLDANSLFRLALDQPS
jgi:NAD(P)-dependent dehydrogenase (short-subunit alcohol dehydrogenase family)